MNKLRNRIMQIHFAKFFRRFIIAAVLAVFVSGIAAGFAFRTQISEVISYVHSVKTEKQEYDTSGERRQALIADHEAGRSEFNREKHDDRFENIPITEPAAGAKIMLGIFGLLCLAVFGIYWMTVAAWLYQSAVRSGLHGLLWFLLALGGNVFAVILFLLVRSFLCEKCENCGKWQDRKHKFCVSCGAMMFDICPDCETACRSREAYCPGCGRKLHDGQK
jgi:hypothetical protein